MNRALTLTEHILTEEKTIKDASGHLTILLERIAEAGKIIAAHVKRSGLVDIIGKTGDQNVYNEDVQKLDEFSNKVLIDLLSQTGYVSTIASEELEQPMAVHPDGEYVVFLDPLDGSSNIDVNVSVGTIFSIYRRKESLVYMGMEQVASGYILYGSSVMFVYTCLNTVNGFTLDPEIGSFLLSNPDIKIPESFPEYSLNEGNAQGFDAGIHQYLTTIKSEGKPYRLRYVGSLIADIHRILTRGGIFLYPHDTKNPSGKLRLMHEVNPIGLVVHRAGGMAVSSRLNEITQEPINVLTISGESIHQRTPAVLGSKREVEKFVNLVHNK